MLLVSKSLCRSSFKIVQRLGHGHHGPSTPPFARLRPPTKSVSFWARFTPLLQLNRLLNLNYYLSIKLNEETELVWDDSVAPESTIDFDAPHVSSGRVLLSFFAAFGFFAGCFGLVYLSDPEGRNPVAPRSAVISQARLLHNLGQGPAPEELEDDA